MRMESRTEGVEKRTYQFNWTKLKPKWIAEEKAPWIQKVTDYNGSFRYAFVKVQTK